jgi:hypothetical protein
MIRKGLRPRIRIAFDVAAASGEFRRVLPFRRSWIAIGLIAVLDLIFAVPAIMTFRQAAAGWASLDTLFDLVGALFLSAWLLGWVLAPLALTILLALLLFGREVVSASPARFSVFLGLPGAGVTADYDLSRIRNLRIEQPPKKSARAWRGTHLVFDYGANSFAFGSDIDVAELGSLRDAVESASGATLRAGDATPEELEPNHPAPASLAQRPSVAAPAVPRPQAEPVTLASLSTLVLIAANLVPLAGATYFGWKLSDVMVLYWAESAVIGLFNVARIAVVGRWLALVAAPFFISHFGAFMAIHFLFIYGFFVQGPGDFSAGELSQVATTFTDLWPALLVLFLSHGVSFFINFLGRKEYRERTTEQLMSEPYSRILFMHLVIIFGGGLTLILGEPTPVLLLVIVLKTWVDVRAHLKQHEQIPA